jgi:hypothetical protein
MAKAGLHGRRYQPGDKEMGTDDWIESLKAIHLNPPWP